MAFKPSKRDKLRGLLKNTGHSLSDLFWSPPPTPSSSGAHSTKDTTSAALKAALQGLRKSTGLVPALMSFIDTLADCVDNIPAAAKNRREYEDLAYSTAASANRLQEHIGDVKHEQIAKVVERVIESYVETEADIDDLVRFYRRIDSLLRQLQ
ncbi:hypothetical protein FRC07_004216, partial [Ceratobasidium sp. 392]